MLGSKPRDDTVQFDILIFHSASSNILYDHLNNCDFKNMVENVALSEHKNRRASDSHTIPHPSLTILLPSYALKEVFTNTLQILFHPLIPGDQPGTWNL